MGLKTLSFLTLLLPSLYILLSSLSLPNLANAEPAQPNNDASQYISVELLDGCTSNSSSLSKLDKDIGSEGIKVTNCPTFLNVRAQKGSGYGYIVTVSTDKSHSNLTREKTNPNDQDNQVINPVQAGYSDRELLHLNNLDDSSWSIRELFNTADFTYSRPILKYLDSTKLFAYDSPFRFIPQQDGSSLTSNTWGFLPISFCAYLTEIQRNLTLRSCEGVRMATETFKSARFYKVPDKDNPVTLKDSSTELDEDKAQSRYAIYYGAKPGSNLPAGTYSTNVVYTVTPKLPPIAPPTISKVINDTHYTTKSDLTAIEGTNLKTTTSVFIDFNKDGKADSNELATNLKTYPGTAKEDTVISFNSPTTNTPGEYDVYVTTNGGIAKLDQSYIVSKFSPCQSGNAKNDCRVDLDNNMIPVKYTGNTTAPKWESLTDQQIGLNGGLPDDQIGQWYDYNSKQWANAVTVKDPNKYKNQNKVVDENDVLGYFVYIPRYAYEVMRPNATDKVVTDDDYKLPDNTSIKHPGFMINFENKYNLFKTPGDSTSCSSISGSTLTTKDYRTQCAKDLGYSRLNPETDSAKANKTTWATHPAFRWQYTKAINGIDKTQDLNGFWVGKYETTGSNTAPTVKPNSRHIGRALTDHIGTYYDIAKSLGQKDNYNPYGNNTAIPQNSHHLSNYSSHMLKNTEWGVITYLSSSTYGAGLNKVNINGNLSIDKDGNNEYSTGITGCGPQSETSTSAYKGCNTYNTNLGQLASTTNNPTGIYDMFGGAGEYTMASLTDSPNQTESNVYPVTNPIKPPYVDLYRTAQAGGKFGVKPAWSTSNDEYSYNNDVCTWETCGGQALHETKLEQSVDIVSLTSWGKSNGRFPKNLYDRWMSRGDEYYDNGRFISGLFYSNPDAGSASVSSSFRTAISSSL